MELYDAIYKRRIIRDFTDQTISEDILEKIINAGLQAPTHDHLRNWEFVIIQNKRDKENVLQFVKQGVEPTLEILKKNSGQRYSSAKNVCHSNAQTIHYAIQCFSHHFAVF